MVWDAVPERPGRAIRGRDKRMAKVLNINDIARLAGVSRSTVSRVLTNNKNVKLETAVKVRQAIKEVNYRPNVLARGLATGRLNIIALLLSEARHPYYLEMFERLDTDIRNRGYMLSVCYLGRNEEERCANFRAIQQYGFAGYIIGDVRNEPAFIDELAASTQPLVLFNRYIETLPDHDAVVVDNFEGGYMAGKHLTDLGHREFAMLTGPMRSSASRDRYRGFVTALGESGIEMKPDMVEEGNLSLAAGSGFAARLFAKNISQCSAVFAGNDSMAVGILNYCRDNNIQVPGELSIIGFDDLSFTGAAEFRLTTVQQPFAQLSSAAAERILARVDGDEHPGQRITLEPRLIVRGTTGPA